MLEHGEPEDPLVPIDPFVHPAQLDVRNHVVDRVETHRFGDPVLARFEIGESTLSLDEGMDRVTVRPDPGGDDLAVVAFDDHGLVGDVGPPVDREFERGDGVGYCECDVVHTGSVEMHVIRHRMLRSL